MKIRILSFVILIIFGCNQQKFEKIENVEIKVSEDTLNTASVHDVKINYDIMEEFSGQGGLYTFSAPKGLFKKIAEDEFSCELLQGKIKFTFIQTNQFDQEGIFSKKDLMSLYKKKLAPSYFVDKNDWFVLSGTNSENKIIYLKGFYEEFTSMQGRDEGEPTWLWSKSGILEIQYAKQNKEEFDKLIPLIIGSFKCNFWQF